MLYIEKRAEPPELLQAKRNGLRHYDDMTSDVKAALRLSLAEEQGYLCAYCMKRLVLKTMQIEHYLPQNSPLGDADAASTIDYGNMLGVCPGNKNQGMSYQGLTCDQHRGNTPLFINPLKQGLVSQITYMDNGTIYSKNEYIDKDLNITLNLNCTQAYLPIGRKTALDTLKEKIYKECGKKGASKAYLQKLHDSISRKKSGHLTPYLGIMLDYLQKRIRRADS